MAPLSRFARRYQGIGTGPTPSRSESRRDRDRILYSLEFQRLAGVTQVASPTERFPVHNRLTHSIKVAQVGRSIAERLSIQYPQIAADGWIDPDSVEAACLAHDLGHPPFGHNSERELDALLLDQPGADDSLIDGFEGNAQSFRIVTKLSVRLPEDRQSPGLNLTAGTLNALLKYPRPQVASGERLRKWGYYFSEEDDFLFCRANTGYANSKERALEAAIMDIADDITYAVHDAEDFFRAGLLPLSSMSEDSFEREWFLQRTSIDRSIAAASLDSLVMPRFQGVHADLAQLAEFRSSRVDRFIRGIDIEMQSDLPVLRIEPHIDQEIKVLKDLTTLFVIESPAVQTQRYGQRRMVRTLFEIYLEEASKPAEDEPRRKRNLQVFPPLYQERLMAVEPSDIRSLKRHLADQIAAMAETQIVDTFQKLTGQSQGSVVDPIA